MIEFFCGYWFFFLAVLMRENSARLNCQFNDSKRNERAKLTGEKEEKISELLTCSIMKHRSQTLLTNG